MEDNAKLNKFLENDINPVVLEYFHQYIMYIINIMFLTYLGDKFYENREDKIHKWEGHFLHAVISADQHFSLMGYEIRHWSTLAVDLFDDVFFEHFYKNPKKNGKLKENLVNKFSFIHPQGGLNDKKFSMLKKYYEYFILSFKNSLNQT